MHYYNEIEPYAADWLENLIYADVIPEGIVDRRDIRDVRPTDLAGFTSCHFFAGLGGWAYALRLAGWPDDRPVWTGSCPCQPFSAAGKGLGFADERHLWPAWHWLILQRRPDVIFGEQVDKALDWLDLVSTDLEGEDYAFGSIILPAAGNGAPHGRHRMWFVADSLSAGRAEGRAGAGERSVARSGELGGLADSRRIVDERLSGPRETPGTSGQIGTETQERERSRIATRAGGASSLVGDPNNPGPQGRRLSAERLRELLAGTPGLGNFWADADWIYCRDGKYRPVEPGTFPLAHGIPDRVGRLRAYGNAIVPQVAAEVIRAYLSASGGPQIA